MARPSEAMTLKAVKVETPKTLFLPVSKNVWVNI